MEGRPKLHLNSMRLPVSAKKEWRDCLEKRKRRVLPSMRGLTASLSYNGFPILYCLRAPWRQQYIPTALFAWIDNDEREKEKFASSSVENGLPE